MNIDPKIIEKAAKALHELACVDTLAGHACGHSSHEGDANHLEAAVVLHEVADDLRAEGAASLRPLLRDLIDPNNCWFDHAGGCQAHGYLSLKPGEVCPHEEAKELLRHADQIAGQS